IPELESLYYTADAESASVTLNLVDRGERDRSSSQVADGLRPFLQDIAGCEITVNASDMTAMLGGSDISVEITGEDYATLSLIADDLLDEIVQLEDAVDVVSSVAEQVPQVEVTINREAASQYGLTAAAIGA